jgi:hypothetical protein
MTPELHTMPSFVYEQLNEDECMIERPIEVVYWSSQVELIQDGRNILIQSDDVKELFKAIVKNFSKAKGEPLGNK